MKFKSIFSVFIALFLFLSPACSAPSESTDETLGLNADFMRGFDASMVSQLEEYGSSFYNENGAKEDIFKILKAHGVNWIRLRIWNEPQDSTPGQNNYERTLAMAKRIKQNGLKFLLDFHYSDSWADPAKQSLPAEWDNVSSIEELCSKVSEYTKKILTDLKSEGCAPDLVQLGNEINSGMFLTKSDGTTASRIDCYSWTGHTEGNKNLLKVLQSASSAVSEIDSSIKKMIHLASSKGDNFDWWFKNLQNLKGVDYDYIGLSYYPFEEHGTLKQLRENIAYLKKTYKKQVLVAETSWAWSMDAYGDNTNNIVWYTPAGTQAAKNLVDNKSTQLKNLKTQTYKGSKCG
ncbi:glycosyl hydrolase 53 family protein [uncultured Treponema sp.]|uniref:glycoside hydrolase family 53 protein n=1 Tax=uncultured Treponema sp. TaxID=162155 RepID=UPI002598EB11|nr:glycosyl hydrolase 53 family protein [uncultured Treponema sp.]